VTFVKIIINLEMGTGRI